ncbi:hypothetical protein Tco_0893018 [Tanacetum coccineum]|uniref:CCHC-type domain-containing protein n=1 Tax=Tanacetum coccineum TaxID=301880 RepID=A0ABQ5C7T5_9ASTR
MTTLAEHIIVAGAENHPPMLEKSIYDSWASHIRLFIKVKKHGRMMLNSIDNGLLVYPTVEENGQTRPKKYFELFKAQQLQDDCDVQAKNIILYGLPPDVYALVNYQEAAKDIWVKVKMLMKGTKLSYQEHECRLYNLFDKFAHVQGETLYEYYWRFSQPINDMHTIGMTMQQVQVNTKFLNALPSEWSKFVTDVKLAKSLYTTNYDQLYAYLSHHERHANKVRISRERYLDPLAFVANSPTLYNPSQSLQHSGIATTLKGNVIASQPIVVKCYNCQGEWHMARQCTQPKRPRNAAWFKEKLMLAKAQEAGQILDEEQLAFLADPDDLDAYDSDCDDLSLAKAVLMANLSSCDPEVLSEVPYFDSYPNDMINQDVQEMQYTEQTHVDNFEDHEIHSVLSLVEQMTNHVAYLDKENQTNKMVNESVTTELERYKERITIFEQRLNVDLNQGKKLIDSQMDDLIRDKKAKLAAFQQEIDTLKETLFNNVKEKESLLKTLTIFKTESKEKESKYIDKEIVLEKQNKELENIIFLKDTFNAFDKTLLDEITKVQNVFNQMEAAVDQCSIDKNVFEIQIKQLRIDNDQLLNQIIKCLELETEILKKKDFIEKEAYDKLVKSYSTLEKHCISLELATQLNQEIFQRENSGENLNAPTFNQLLEINELKAQSQEKDTVIRKLKDRIKSLSGKDNVENVKKGIDDIETVNIELEHSVAKLLSKNENLRKERHHLKSIYKDQFDSIKKTRVQSKEHCDSLIAQINAKSVENSDLNAQLQEKVFAIIELKNELSKLKGKNVVNTAELLVYVSQTGPSSPKPSGKLVAVTPMNKDKRVRFAEPITSSSNKPKQTDSLKTKDSNKPLLTCIGVKPTTSASGSKPSGNTKNNRITRPPSSNLKNKVEDHSRKVKSSLNKTNSVSQPVTNALVKHSMRNAKLESMCAICNKCLFDANHDMCIIDYVNDVNVRLKSKSKRNKKRKVWKPTGKVFTNVGYKWKPTGRFFTIVGNSCPLTRITPKNIVHLKETTSKSVETPKPEIKVYSRIPKQIKSVDVPSSSSLVNNKLSRSFSGIWTPDAPNI